MTAPRRRLAVALLARRSCAASHRRSARRLGGGGSPVGWRRPATRASPRLKNSYATERHDRGTQLPDPADAGTDAEDAGRQRIPLPGDRRQTFRLRRYQDGQATAGKPRSENSEPAAPVPNATASAPAQVAEHRGGGACDSRRGPALSPKTFGTITFDASGNVTGGSVGDQATIGRAGAAPGRSCRSANPAAAAARPTRQSRRCPRPMTLKSSTAIRTSSSSPATTARRRPGSVTTSPASRMTRKRRTLISGWARLCLGKRNTAMRRRCSSRPTRTIRNPGRRPKCC